jgi:hypothetical protein
MNSIKFFTKKLINLFVVAPIRFILISIKQNKGIRDKTIHSILWNEATNDSAVYVKNFLPEVLLFDNKQSLWDFTISKIEALSPCDILEFGCYKATSINYFSTRLPNNKFYGFDSFKGLPGDWFGQHLPMGTFDLKSNLPTVSKNVELIPGWFDESLPKFFEKNSDLNAFFLHIDSDTYDSASTVLMNAKDLLKPGVLVLFDEYLSYPNWENGEFLAWQEFCSQNSIKYRYLGFATEQALIEIISI